MNPAPAPATEKAWLVEGLRVLLIDPGVLAAQDLPHDDIGWDLVMGQEWLALDLVLATVWPPDKRTDECHATAAKVALALVSHDGEPEPDGDATPEQYVDRWVEHRPVGA